jgi:hypothetical protein
MVLHVSIECGESENPIGFCFVPSISRLGKLGYLNPYS